MFQKTKQQEPQQPQLLGEDFDIFPDIHAHDQDDERKEVDQEKPVQSNETAQTPEPDEPDEPTDFEKKIASI